MRTPLTPRSRRLALVLATGVLLATGATACEPAEPGVFTVMPAATGADVEPGNGTCENDQGRCSLQAAVEEANALDTASEITVPAGTLPAVALEVTGSITLLNGNPQPGSFQGLGQVSWTVAEGGQLSVTDADLGPVVVEGTFLSRRVLLGSQTVAGADALVEVAATGTALLSNAEATSTSVPLAINAGVLSIHGATVVAAVSPGPATITTATGGQTRLSATAFLGGNAAVDACAGPFPTSYGYNLVSDTSCDAQMTGDRQDFDATSTLPLAEGDARVEAIPVGTLHCGGGWSDDLTSGTGPARPADSDNSGTAACEVGARELGQGG